MKKSRAVVLALFVLLTLAAFLQARYTAAYASLSPVAKETSAAPETQRPARRPARTQRTARQPQRRASAFSHATPQHRQACDTCHKFPSANWKNVGRGDEAYPDVTQYPAHASCIGCHRQQFFSNEKPSPSICAVCHESAVPRRITLYPFPTVTEAFDKSPKAARAGNDFHIYFPHEPHLAMLGRIPREEEDSGSVRFVRASFTTTRAKSRAQDDAAKANESCATCHQTYMPQGDSDEEFVTKPPADLPEGAFWLKKGTFKSSPRGHSSCFTCHSVDAGISPAPSDCASCHKFPPAGEMPPSDFDMQTASRMGVTDRRMLALWSRRQTGTYRHEWFSHAEMKCTDCHKVEEMNTADPRTTRVGVISCGGGGSGCHITETDGDGGVLNQVIAQRQTDPSFTCTKCHVVLGSRPVPVSHISALDAIRKK